MPIAYCLMPINDNVMKGAVGTADFLHKFHTAPMVVYAVC